MGALQQITFSRAIKNNHPVFTKFIVDPSVLKGAELLMTTRKGGVYYFKVNEVTHNQLRTSEPVLGDNCYLYFNYCEKLEDAGQVRFFLLKAHNTSGGLI